jgi:hypothetical protein
MDKNIQSGRRAGIQNNLQLLLEIIFLEVSKESHEF